MLYKVYHSESTREIIWGERGDVLENFNEGRYDFVASLEAEDFDEVYMRTNSIYRPWYEAEDIIELGQLVKKQGGARSTSVGDIIIQNDGQVFFVARMGFEFLLKFGEE